MEKIFEKSQMKLFSGISRASHFLPGSSKKFNWFFSQSFCSYFTFRMMPPLVSLLAMFYSRVLEVLEDWKTWENPSCSLPARGILKSERKVLKIFKVLEEASSQRYSITKRSIKSLSDMLLFLFSQLVFIDIETLLF